MLSGRVSSTFAALCLWAASGALASAQVVSVWLTTDDQQTLMAPRPTVSFTPGASSQLPSIFISESQAEQTIEGFGASMTDSAAYLLNEKVPPALSPPLPIHIHSRTPSRTTHRGVRRFHDRFGGLPAEREGPPRRARRRHAVALQPRSEERRVGKESRCRW